MLFRFKHFRYMAPEGDGSSGGGSLPAGSGADAAGTNTNQQAPDGGLTLGDGTTWRNANELKDALKTVRELEREYRQKLQGGTPAPQQAKPAPVPETPAFDAAALEARFSFREALVDNEVPKERRAIVERLWNAEKEKPADVGAWMKSTLADLGIKAESAGKPASQPPPIAPSNTGAPVRDPGGANLPDNPWLWPKDVAEKLGFEAFHEARQKYESRNGKHPYDDYHRRRSERSGHDNVSELARRVAAEVKKG
jgi:hypothetical protein